MVMLGGEGARGRRAEGAELVFGGCAVSCFVGVNPCCQVNVSRRHRGERERPQGPYVEECASPRAGWMWNAQHYLETWWTSVVRNGGISATDGPELPSRQLGEPKNRREGVSVGIARGVKSRVGTFDQGSAEVSGARWKGRERDAGVSLHRVVRSTRSC